MLPFYRSSFVRPALLRPFMLSFFGLSPLMLSVTAQEVSAHPLPEAHAPAKLMNEHTHQAREWMFGYRYERMDFSGYSQGKREISAEDVALAGYTMGSTGMTMDMHMLDIMYAPTDRLTLMLMPHYMTMDMDMIMLDGAGAGGHGHAGMDHGSASGGHSHSVSGWGDTLLSASYQVNGTSHQGLIATLGVYAPTGSVDIKNASGQYTHYDMQLGSGTWDLLTSVTYRGQQDIISYGVQLNAITRLESENESGYVLGDKYTGSTWVAYRVQNWLSLSARLGYTHQDDIGGHYNGPHAHSSPMDIQQNYGGSYWDWGVGANLVNQKGIRLGLEWSVPFNEDYNGIQMTRNETLSVSLSYAFR